MLTKDIEENFPFLSVVSYGANEYIGIISNQDQHVTSMYIFTNIRDEEDKKIFLELGDAWWWESNRMIPINIFLKGEFDRFRYCIMTMNTKDVVVTIGPTVNLNNLALKRVKRKNVQLIRRMR
jgi:hypothetical protein